MAAIFFDTLDEAHSAAGETGLSQLIQDFRIKFKHFWLTRQYISELNGLEPHILTDIGIDPEEIHAAAAKRAHLMMSHG